ncbi:hypothetical protein M422DRAFT_180652, partial [Sphaerobolus stellatus SS14]
PIIAWDCKTSQEVMIILAIHHLPADNPMQSLLASHIGLKGNCFCQKCYAGGSQEFKQLNEGYDSLFKMGIKDSLADKYQKDLIAQRRMLEGEATASGKDAYTPETVAMITQQQESWLSTQKETIKPLLSDTPAEPLYTVLLGVIKYIWGITCTAIGQTHQLGLLETQLASINTDGLGIPPLCATYLIQYCGGLIGRQFKAIMQTMTFALHDIVSGDILTVWKAAGKVGALLWYPEIMDVEAYLTELSHEIDNLLDDMAIVDPSRIIQKPKFHILLHIVEDIR